MDMKKMRELFMEEIYWHFSRRNIYRFGGQGRDGVDCSGLVMEGFWASGRSSSSDMTAQGIYEFIGIENLSRPVRGALAFYGNGPRDISHIAVCEDEDTVIEAGGGDRRTTSDEMADKQNAQVRRRPLTYRRDLVAVLDPWREAAED